jgi:hypothetical protein
VDGNDYDVPVRTNAKRDIWGRPFFWMAAAPPSARRESPSRPAIRGAQHVRVPSRRSCCRVTSEGATVQRELDPSPRSQQSVTYSEPLPDCRSMTGVRTAPNRILARLFCLNAPTVRLGYFVSFLGTRCEKSHDVRQSPTLLSCLPHFLPNLTLGRSSHTCLKILFVTLSFGFFRERDS